MNVLNGKFSKVEVTGMSKKEALDKAPFAIMGDATQAWKGFQKKNPNYTEADAKEFMLEYLNKKSKMVPGVGFYITRKAAVDNTRERPYKIENVKNELGRTKFKTVYRWVDNVTKETVVEVDTTKADAVAALKNMYTKKGYKGDAKLIKVKIVKEGQEVAAIAKYTPSKSATIGEYVVFGVEK